MKMQRLTNLLVFAGSTMLILFLLISPANAAETVLYSEGFEIDTGSYTVSGNAEWEWGSPSGIVGPGSAHNGTKCWGTDLDNTLNRPAEGSIISPAITLPSILANQTIRIRFWAFVSIDGMYDRDEFFVSSDGSSWESVCEFFHTMSTSPTAPPSWNQYEFTIDPSYAGGSIYLRFRSGIPYSSYTFYCGGTSDLSGFYVDDIVVTLYDYSPSNPKLLSLEAWEDPSAWASCPWIAPWNGTEFDADNDVYSVARTEANEYVDYYKLMKPLVARNGVYSLELQELENEDSFTDFMALIQVDHAPDVSVLPDNAGNLLGFIPSSLFAPLTAVSNQGEDLLSLLSTSDNTGFAAYSEDTVIVDFGNADVSQGAIFLLRVLGFVLGEGEEKPYIGPPAIVVETMDGSGLWQERGRLKPRYDYSEVAINLSSYLSNDTPRTVRLRSISHSIKYHEIDSVALYAGAQPEFSITETSPSAANFGTNDVLDTVLVPDGNYFEMSSGETLSLEFPVVSLDEGTIREFIFIAKGYYIPQGSSYLIYTWDGTKWVMRDARSYPGSDATKVYDLSLFLPDPDGEYKVQVWQDYQYRSAGIDYVKMEVGGVIQPLFSAYDYKKATSVYSLVLNSDDVRNDWYTVCPRDRVCEFGFTPVTPNTPPTTNPVSVPNPENPNFTIQWTYNDSDGDPQAWYEVEIWTGPGGTGMNVWDPPAGSGDTSSVTYSGSVLPCGTYYARVKAYDGKDWGQWSEGSFDIPCNLPPVAEADGPYIGDEGSPVTFDGSGSSDPDGDPITYDWNFGDGTGTGSGVSPTYTYGDNVCSYTVTLTVTDTGSLSDTDTAAACINNVAPIVGEITAPEIPVSVGTEISCSAPFSDPGWLDTHAAFWDWGDTTSSAGTVVETDGSGTASGTHTYNLAGIYTITLIITDDDGGVGSISYQYVVVYDPDAGFVTGGGWIDSPERAYFPDPTLTGKANFGFVSKYKKGASVPTGSTEFQFSTASFNFHSNVQEWLVVNQGGTNAQFKGEGTINGSNDINGNPYKFMLWAGDDDPDTFRIKIWYEVAEVENVVYDNGFAQTISGGSIVIHTK